MNDIKKISKGKIWYEVSDTRAKFRWLESAILNGKFKR